MATIKPTEETQETSPNLQPLSMNREAQETEAVRKREEISLPTSPGRLVEYEVMREWLQGLSTAQWENVAIYLYRSYPKILREQVEENLDDKGNAVKYIDCMYEPFTREDIVSNHGGGRYIFWINDVGAAKKRETLFKSRLNISMDEADPIINPAELDWSCKENQPYINKMRALGKIRGQEFVNPITQTASMSTEHSLVEKLLSKLLDMNDSERQRMRERNPDNIILERAIESAQKGSERSLDFMVKQLDASKKEDPAGMIVAMAQLMKEFRPTEKSNDNSLLVAMMNNQMELTKLMIQNQNSGSSKEDGDEFTKLKTLLEIAKDLKGGRTTESGWVDKAIEHGAPILGKVFDTINHVMTLRARGIPARMPTNQQMQQGRPGQQPQQRQVNSAIPGGWGQRAVDRQATTPQQPGPQPVEPEVVLQQQVTQEQEFVLQYGGLILQNMASGPGDDFAAWVSEGLGPAAFLNIKRMGKENILAALKSVPEFWEPAMQNFEETHVIKFVDEFFSFDPYTQTEEGDE